MSDVLVEVCVDDSASVAVAIEAGAQRIELCAALGVGGLTPSEGAFELAHAACREADVGLAVLVRPRPGGFAYGAADRRVMLADIERWAARADAIVVGALTRTGDLDEGFCADLVEAARPAQAVMHRAFDLLPYPGLAFDRVTALGFDRLLTSGGRPSIHDGAEVVRALVERSTTCTVLGGGGLVPERAGELVGATGLREIHLSARGGAKQAADSFGFGNHRAVDPGRLAQLFSSL